MGRSDTNRRLSSQIETEHRIDKVIVDKQAAVTPELIQQRLAEMKEANGGSVPVKQPVPSNDATAPRLSGTPGTVVMPNGDVVPIALVPRKTLLQLGVTPPEPKKKLPPPKARAAKRKASDISPGWDEVVPPNLEEVLAFLRMRGYLDSAGAVGGAMVGGEGAVKPAAVAGGAEEEEREGRLLVVNGIVVRKNAVALPQGPTKSAVEVVFDRDGRRCCYCFKQLGLTDATVDHVLPVAAGGPNMPENMHSSCSPCNSAKSCFWLGDLQWTVQDPVGFPPATIGEQARPCPFVAPPGDAVVYMSDLCFKVRAIVRGLKEYCPRVFHRINGGFPGNFYAVRQYVEEHDVELRDSPLLRNKRRRMFSSESSAVPRGLEGEKEREEGPDQVEGMDEGQEVEVVLVDDT